MQKRSYKDAVFWEQKYKSNCCETYEWICTPELLLSSIGSHIQYNDISKVLELGCGTSSLAAKLFDEAAVRKKEIAITCVDFSKELIKKCRQKSARASIPIEYLCLDVRNMSSLADGEFDCILDKGCIDCLFCHDSFIKQVLVGLKECYRLLKDGGRLILVSHGRPKVRTYLLRNRLVPFNLKIQKITRGQSEIYAYVCIKGTENINNTDQNGEVQPHQQSDDDDHASHEEEGEKKKEEPKKQQIDAPFILDDKKQVRKKNNSQIRENDAPFILEPSANENANEEDSAPFILSESNSKPKESKTAQAEQPNEQQLQNKAVENEDQAKFILDEAEYDNQFQQGA